MIAGGRIAMALAALLAAAGCQAQTPSHGAVPPIDHDRAVLLDAEELAEQGMAAAYEAMAPRLRAIGVTPDRLTETVNSGTASYSVRFRGRNYPISLPAEDDAMARARATVAFFEIVNAQLGTTSYRFYALNADNELAGILLTRADYRRAMATTRRATDRPYLPALSPPWFGQPHD